MASDQILSLGLALAAFLDRFGEYFGRLERNVATPACRFRRRLLLESLEDRVVPSLAEGTILVGTGPSPFSGKDQSSFLPGIIAVNPNTGMQIRLSIGQMLALPTYIAQAPNQQLYVSDVKAFGDRKSVV